MRSPEDIIKEASDLPVEDRALVVDGLLRTLNTPEAAIDSAWKKVAQRRLEEIRSGRVKLIPGDKVFERIRERFAR